MSSLHIAIIRTKASHIQVAALLTTKRSAAVCGAKCAGMWLVVATLVVATAAAATAATTADELRASPECCKYFDSAKIT